MISYRKRLLASTVTTFLGAGALLAPQAASAACTVAAGVVTCATTTTTNTTNAGGTPASDRNYPVDTSAVPFTGTVSAGAIVDGFGLAFTNTVGGTNALNIVNSGTVQVNAGNLASAGGAAALEVTAIGATPVNYSGAGNIINLGTGGNGLTFNMTGTGALVATVGGNVTSAAGASNISGTGIAVFGTGASGNLALTTTAARTITADFIGIDMFVSNVASTSAISLTNNSAIVGLVANGLDFGIVGESSGLGAVSVINNGAIGSAADRINITGIYSAINNAASTAALGVSGSGAVFSSGTGLFVSNAGTGATTVNYTGAVNTTGATGVDVNAATGSATVTTGAVTAATNAVDVASLGTQTITLNGVTTGTAGSGLVSDTTGTRTVTVGLAGNVTGGTQAILLSNTGGGSVTNNGIVGSAPAALAVNAATATGAVAVTNAGTGTLNGRLTLGAGADTFTNNGIFNTQGITDFGAGADAMSNNLNGVINILGNTTFANLEAFTQNARLNLNNFVLTGPAIAFVNGTNGFVDTSGSATIAGFTSLTNNGTFDLAAGTLTVPVGAFLNNGLVIADEGLTTITGQASFANAGTIDLLDGANNDVLTINSSYAGAGTLQVDTSSILADRLVVGAITGTTLIDVNGLDNGFIDPLGVLVVDGTSSTANAFLIGNQSGVSPLVNYDIRQSGSDYFIVTGPSAAAFQPLVLAAASADIWYQSADEVIAQTRMPNDLDGPSFWGQVYGSKDKSGENDLQVLNGFAVDADNKTDNTRYGFQLGADIGLGGIARVGLTGGYERAEVEGAADLDLKGWNIGVYGMVGGPLGFHGEALFKYDDFDVDVDKGRVHWSGYRRNFDWYRWRTRLPLPGRMG